MTNLSLYWAVTHFEECTEIMKKCDSLWKKACVANADESVMLKTAYLTGQYITSLDRVLHIRQDFHPKQTDDERTQTNKLIPQCCPVSYISISCCIMKINKQASSTGVPSWHNSVFYCIEKEMQYGAKLKCFVPLVCFASNSWRRQSGIIWIDTAAIKLGGRLACVVLIGKALADIVLSWLLRI